MPSHALVDAFTGKTNVANVNTITSDSGDAYTTNTSNDSKAVGIDAGGKMYHNDANTGFGAAAFSQWVPPSPAYGAQINFDCQGAPAGAGALEIGVIIRAVENGPGAQWNGYLCGISTLANGYYINKTGVSKATKTFTAAANGKSIGSASTPVAFKIYAKAVTNGDGSVTITLYDDGVSILTYTDPSGSTPLTAAGKVGVRFFSPGTTTTTGAHVSFLQSDPVAATLTGPSTCTLNTASTNFTFTMDAPAPYNAQTYTITPSDTLASTASPASVNIAAGSKVGTFTVTPTAAGSHSVSVVTNQGVTAPSPVAMAVTGPTTAYTVTGPTIGSVGIGSSAFTIIPNGTTAESVPLSDGGAGGTWLVGGVAATSVTFTGDGAAKTCNYVAATAGVKTLSFGPGSSTSAAVTGSPITYTASTLSTYDSAVAFGTTGLAGSVTITPKVFNGTAFSTPAGTIIGSVVESAQPGTYFCRVSYPTSVLTAGGAPVVEWSIAGALVTDPTPVNAVPVARDNNGAVTVGANNDKVGYALTTGERAAIATVVETQILDETDTRTILAAIVAKINATDTNLAGLTTSAIAAAVRAEVDSNSTKLAYLTGPVALASQIPANFTSGLFASSGVFSTSALANAPTGSGGSGSGATLTQIQNELTTRGLTSSFTTAVLAGTGGGSAPTLTTDGGTVNSSQTPSVSSFAAGGSSLNPIDGGYSSLPQTVYWTSGALAGTRYAIQRHRVVGSNHVFNCSTMPQAPAVGDTFVIL
jgi:hypothetical protein